MAAFWCFFFHERKISRDWPWPMTNDYYYNQTSCIIWVLQWIATNGLSLLLIIPVKKKTKNQWLFVPRNYQPRYLRVAFFTKSNLLRTRTIYFYGRPCFRLSPMISLWETIRLKDWLEISWKRTKQSVSLLISLFRYLQLRIIL